MKPFLFAALTFIFCWSTALPAEIVETRAAWVHIYDCTSKKKVDALLDKAERAHLNALFVLLNENGYAYYGKSRDLAFSPNLNRDFDPVAYLIEGAHRRKIEFHGWFINAHLAYFKEQRADIYRKHPEWFLMDRSGNRDPFYADFGSRSLRNWEAQMMADFVRDYPADGVHLDYIRFPEGTLQKFCYCDECRSGFKSLHGKDPRDVFGLAFPCVVSLKANSFSKATTAKTVAVFEDGTPAILVHSLGQGNAILFNFSAARSLHPAIDDALIKAIEVHGRQPHAAQLLASSENFEKYSNASFVEAKAQLENGGIKVKEVDLSGLKNADPAVPLVIPEVYVMSETTVGDLEAYVQKGGTAIFLDGPVLASNRSGLAALLGMTDETLFSNQLRTISPAEPSDFIEKSWGTTERLGELARKWDQFRFDNVTAMVREAHDAVKKVKPGIWFTAAVFWDRPAWTSVFQDWPSWVEKGIVDYTIPMAYTPDDAVFEKCIADWKEACGNFDHVIAGIGAFEGKALADPTVVLSKVERSRKAGLKGVCFFVLDFMTEDLILALRNGPFQEKAVPYHPGH